MSKRSTLIVLAVALALLLPSLFQILRPFFTSFVLASILAIVVHPLNVWLSRKVRPFGLATFITTSTAVFLLSILIGFAGFAITRELTATYGALNRRSLEEGGWPALVTHTADRIVDALAVRVPFLDKEAIRTELLDGMKAVTGYLLNTAGAALGGFVSVIVTGLFVTIFLYFLLRYGQEWTAGFAALIPLDRHVAAGLFHAVHRSVVANVNGMLAVMMAQGLLLCLGFWIVGVRSPVLWGAIGGLCSIIPVVGSPLVWVPVVIAFVVMGAYGKALLLAAWGALIVGSVDNILRPFVVNAGDKQHPIIVGLAAIGGTYAFGVLGILLGPLMVSLVEALLMEIQKLVSMDREPDVVSSAGSHPPPPEPS